MDLNSILELNDNRYIVSTVSDIFTQPFSFDLLLQSFLKEGRSLFVILLSQNWQHYSAVATKCGVNVKHLKENQQLKVLDLLDYDGAISTEKTSYIYDWDVLQNDILERISDLPEECVIMIDDLSVLLSLNFSITKIYALIRRVRRTLARKNCTLFVGSFYQTEDEQLNTLITSLIHECHIWLDCDKPQTGYSMQIHGIAKCFNRLHNKCNSFNYRISNRNVIFKRI